MTQIDHSTRPISSQPAAVAADTLAPAAARSSAGAVQTMSLEEASQAQAQATQKLTSAFQTKTNLAVQHATSAAATAQVRTDLDSASANQSVDIYAIMGLVQKSAQEMRNANREIRASELNSQVGELLSAAKDMQKAANFKLAASIVQGSFQAISAGISLYGNSKAAAKAGGAIGEQNKASQFNQEATQLNKSADNFATQAQDMRTQAKFETNSTAANAKLSNAVKLDQSAAEQRGHAESRTASAKSAQGIVDSANEAAKSISGKADMVGKGFDLAGGMIAAGLNHAASSAEVSAKKHEARAKLHESKSQQANDMMQQMMEVIRDAKDKLASIDQSRIETNRSILRNI